MQLLIEPKNKISIRNQCHIIGLSRSSYYYEPKGESSANELIMKVMDKHILEEPTAGVLTMQSMLKDQDIYASYERIKD